MTRNNQTEALLAYQDQLRSLASELNKAKESERQRLAADLHDNLGQMLAIGKMKLDLLQLGKDELPEQAFEEISALAELMEDAIRYTRELMSDLKPPPSFDKENLVNSISWVIDKMKKHKLDVTLESDHRPKPLDDEMITALRQGVRELLFNVVKHAGVHEAKVTLSRVENQVKITIEDEGRGFTLNKDMLQSDTDGFGLFNLRERLNLLGASLEISSRPGEGTRITLLAPVQSETASEMTKENEDRKTKPAYVDSEERSTIRVMLVDDHRMMREGLRKMILGEDDMEVIEEAFNGIEAVKLAHEMEPDIIVMDVNMPGMDGIEATRRIRADNQQVRIIGLSLQDEEGVINSMRKAGATAYLTKSDVFESLCATIRSEAAISKSV